MQLFPGSLQAWPLSLENLELGQFLGSACATVFGSATAIWRETFTWPGSPLLLRAVRVLPAVELTYG